MKNRRLWIGIVIFSALCFAVSSAPASAQITGSGWTGEYYNNTTLSGSPVATVPYSNGVFANWGDGSPLQEDNATPVPGVGADDFSARYTSTQTFTVAGNYVFTLYVDDGIRVFVDGQVLLDQFNQNTTGTYRTFSFIQYFAAQSTVPIVVEYVEFTGIAIMAIQWGLTQMSSAIDIYEPAHNALVQGDVSPSLVWQHVGAPSYKVVLKNSAAATLLKAAFPAGALCGGVCTLDLGAIPFQSPILLANGRHQWHVSTQGFGSPMKSLLAVFTVAFPGKPLALTPDFNQAVTNLSPTLAWGEIPEASEYRVKITRVKTGEVTVIDWQASASLCDGTYCTLDLSALVAPVVLMPGKYEWRVTARNLSVAPNLSRSKIGLFRVVDSAKSPLPLPAIPPGFRF